jgi:hypothetical protein
MLLTLYHKTDSLVSSSLEPNNADSRTSSSLGPSDSASQNAGSNIDKAAIEHLLKLVEAPSKRPSCLKPFVLWYHEDCQTDKTAGDIVTAANKHRPKMHLIIRCEDGSVISGPEFENIKHSAELLVERLIACVAKNPQRMLVSTSKVPTKSNVKKWFNRSRLSTLKPSSSSRQSSPTFVCVQLTGRLTLCLVRHSCGKAMQRINGLAPVKPFQCPLRNNPIVRPHKSQFRTWRPSTRRNVL